MNSKVQRLFAACMVETVPLRPFARVQRALRLFVSASLVLTATFAAAATVSVTNVTIANVTPSSFSVICQGSGAAAIDVFSDAAGTSNLLGVVSVDQAPVHTGHSVLLTSYERRQSQNGLRSATRSLGISHLRVANCSPGATYYYRLSIQSGASNVVVYPVSGLAAVTTPRTNSFALSSAQLVVDVPGVNNDGQIVLLYHTNSPYALAAVVGDGAGTNQVVFNANDLFVLGGGNFGATGSQDFDATLLGGGASKASQHFALVLDSSFGAAQAQYASFGLEFAALGLSETIVRTGQGGSLPIAFNSSVSVSNLTVQIQFPTNRLTGFSLSNAAAAVNSATMTALSSNVSRLTISARPGQSFQGQVPLGSLMFTASSNQSSAFVMLHMVQPAFAKADGASVANVALQDARVIIIGEEPLLEARADSFGVRHLTMYGKPWFGYALEYTTNLASPNWTLFSRIPLTNYTAKFSNLNGNEGQFFYRAYQMPADPPALVAERATDGSRRLLVFGAPGGNYALQSKPILSGAVTWSPVMTYSLTNSFRYLNNVDTNLASVFYRLQKQ